jgi:hypothetical protein
MAKTLYVYLKGGRGDAKVTEIWDGAAPTEKGMVDASGVIVGTDGKEVGEPYRDISRTSVSGSSSTVGGSVNVTGSLPGVGSIETAVGVSTLTVTPTLTTGSDEVEHVRPRQHYKVYTWLVFADDDGTPYEFRKADVLGWGSYPRR